MGVVLILFWRPQTMFRAGTGSWREFGLSNSGSVTVFPFWMFTLVWAIISYALATLGTMFIAATAIQGAPATTAHSNVTNFVPASTMSAVPPQTLPGYYILDTAAAQAQPKYIYYGTSPPTIANL